MTGDFETMPVGTAALLAEVGSTMRVHAMSLQHDALGDGVSRGRRDLYMSQAQNLEGMAERVEALIAKCPHARSET